MSGETEADVSGWTVDTLGEHLRRRIDDLIRMLDERYATQTKAVDAAFLAQQTAMQTAMTAADRAVQTALLSAEKAVTKAEVAADKRFDGVNEFRAAFADMVREQMPRAEADARLTAMDEKVSELKLAITQGTGRSAGLSAAWGYLLGAVGLAAAVIAIAAR